MGTVSVSAAGINSWEIEAIAKEGYDFYRWSDGAEEPLDIVNRFPGRVEEVVYVGEASVYGISLAPGLVVGVKVQSGPLANRHKPGDKVVIGWRARHSLALH